MIFSRPKDVTLSQMAQWIDANSTKPDVDKDILCAYLFHLVRFRSQVSANFNDGDQQDDFCIYCTYRVLSRLNKEQNTIKSISNYLKNVVPLWKSDYIREYCGGDPDVGIEPFDVLDFADYLMDESSESDFNRYDFDCREIIQAVKKHLSRIPKRRNSAEWTNIYISCLLTIQDRINCAIVTSKKSVLDADPVKLNQIMRSLKTKPPILFHIDDSFSGYIKVLVTEAIHAIAVELSKVSSSKVSASACFSNMVIAAMNSEDE